jgi:hypothetical protein
MADKYNIDVAQEESTIGDWLIANENMLDSDNPQDVKDFDKVREYYKDLQGYYATPEGFAKTAIPAAAGEIGTVAEKAWEVAQNPVDSARNLVGGVFDIATTAATKLLPKDLVDSLYSYENDPDSMQYKVNEYFKTPFKIPYFGNADMSFLSTKPRENYEEMGSQIAGDISNTYDKLSSPESAAKLIANNPLETAVNASGIGSLLKYPFKKAGLLDNEAGQIIDNVTDQSPTSLISGIPQMLKNRKNRQGDEMAAQRVEADTKIKNGINAGYVLPPSAYQGTGETVSKIVGGLPLGIKKGVTDTAILRNQETSNRLARKYLKIPPNTPLEEAMDIIKARSAPAYEAIGKLKGKTLTKTVDVPETYIVKQKQRGGGVREVERTRTNKQTRKQVIHRDGADILKDLKSSREKQKSLYKSGKFDELVEQRKISENLESEITRLARFNGNENIINNLKTARKDYARGYSVTPYVQDGKINVVAFGKGNKKTPLTGEGKIMQEFADIEINRPALIKPTANTGDMSALDQYALAGITVADASVGLPLISAVKTIPSLLLNSASQQKFLDPKYGAGGLLSTLGNTTAVRNTVLYPTLLEQSGIKDIEYMQENN